MRTIHSEQLWHEDLKSQPAKPVAMRNPNPACNCVINILVPGKNIKASIRVVNLSLNFQSFLYFRREYNTYIVPPSRPLTRVSRTACLELRSPLVHVGTITSVTKLCYVNISVLL